MTLKCKDTSHVRVVPTSAVATDRVISCTWVEHGACKNNLTYSDELFVITINGKFGMQMYPSLAVVMPGRLRAAAASLAYPNVMIQHNVRKVPAEYLTLEDRYGLALADRIDALLVEHPVTVA